MKLTIRELAEYVARDFHRTMEDEGFSTFKEMKDCYWWSSEDVRDETEEIVAAAKVENVVMDYVDYELVDHDAGECMPYKQFAREVQKALRRI